MNVALSPNLLPGKGIRWIAGPSEEEGSRPFVIPSGPGTHAPVPGIGLFQAPGSRATEEGGPKPLILGLPARRREASNGH